MVWTEITRAEHDRTGLRFASDCAEEEWRLIAPLLPPPCRRGRPREVDLREVLNAIQYRAATGCQWTLLPKGFPPSQTALYYFYCYRDDVTFDYVNAAMTMASRLVDGREGEPTAGVIDSQSVKSTASGGPRGYYAGKKVKGYKRNIITDTEGNSLEATVTPATARTGMVRLI